MKDHSSGSALWTAATAGPALSPSSSATLNTYNYPAAGAARPYAISSITGTLNGVTNPSFTYDANGNLQSGAGRSLTWTSFNMVSSLSQGSTTLSYLYDAAHQRLKQTSTTGTTTTTTKYFNDPTSGVSAEQLTTAGGTWNDYLFAGGERVGMRSKTTSPAATTWQLYISDPQGSIAVILNTTASVLQRLSYDAWGRPRQANGSADPSGTLTPPTLLSTRGYTDHEHLSGISLINMNGRLYDPEVGQFLSPDPVTQSVYQVQGLNRNSYVLNNPLYYTDPSGFSWWTDVRDDWLKPALGIAVGWYVGPAIFSAVKGYAVAAFGGSAAGSFAASSLAGIASGSLVGGMNGVIFNGPRGFAQGAKSGAIGGAVSGAFAPLLPAGVSAAEQVAANVVVGGVASVLQGGKFQDGMKGALVGMALHYAYDQLTYKGHFQQRYRSREELLAALGEDGYVIGDRPLDAVKLFMLRGTDGGWWDTNNLELLHQNLFYVENGTLKNLGFFGKGGLGSDTGFPGNIDRYRFSPVLRGSLVS